MPDYLTITQAARLLGRSYRATLDDVLRGELRGEQSATGRWRVVRADVERKVLALETERALASNAASPYAEQLGVGAHETLLRMHRAGRAMALLQIEYDGGLEALEADAAEAEQSGDTFKAAELRAIALDMRRATYGIDKTTGKVVLGMRQDDGSVALASPEQPA